MRNRTVDILQDMRGVVVFMIEKASKERDLNPEILNSLHDTLTAIDKQLAEMSETTA